MSRTEPQKSRAERVEPNLGLNPACSQAEPSYEPSQARIRAKPSRASSWAEPGDEHINVHLVCHVKLSQTSPGPSQTIRAVRLFVNQGTHNRYCHKATPLFSGKRPKPVSAHVPTQSSSRSGRGSALWWTGGQLANLEVTRGQTVPIAAPAVGLRCPIIIHKHSVS